MEIIKKFIIEKNIIHINKNDIRKRKKSSQTNINVEPNYSKFINAHKHKNKSQEISYFEEYSQNYLENKNIRKSKLHKNRLVNKSLPNNYCREQGKNEKVEYKKNMIRLSLEKSNENIAGRSHEISSINTKQRIKENIFNKKGNEIELKKVETIIINLKKQIKEQEKKYEELINKNKELEKEKENIINEINKSEKEFNNKISFLEDKENEIEETRKKLEKKIKFFEKIKQENNELIKQNNELKKEVNKYRKKYEK